MCKQVSWKKLAGHQSNHLLEVVTKLDEQVQSVTGVLPKSLRVLDAARVRRKKHYRLESEEKPTFPLQQKNFYNHIIENKEIIKTLSLLSSSTQNVKTVSIQVSEGYFDRLVGRFNVIFTCLVRMLNRPHKSIVSKLDQRSTNNVNNMSKYKIVLSLFSL